MIWPITYIEEVYTARSVIDLFVPTFASRWISTDLRMSSIALALVS